MAYKKIATEQTDRGTLVLKQLNNLITCLRTNLPISCPHQYSGLYEDRNFLCLSYTSCRFITALDIANIDILLLPGSGGMRKKPDR